MNCLEFRRRALADPERLAAENARHAASCAGCADFHARALTLDAGIRQVLDVPVPSGLETRILADFEHERRLERRRFLAVAASLVGLAAGGIAAFRATRDDPAALDGIRFVVEEEATVILAARPVDRADLQRVTRRMQLWLPDGMGSTRYLGPCPYRGGIAHHVIAQTPLGKATLLLEPDRHAEARGSASARGLHALVRPAVEGCATVVSESARNLDWIERSAWRA